VDAPLVLGLLEVLNLWVKSQRDEELDLIRELRADQVEFLKNPKKYGCLFPPSNISMPNISHEKFVFKKTDKLTDRDKREMKECMDILLTSCNPWSAQFSSTPNQHHTPIAISTMQLNRDKSQYQKYLGEDIIWTLFYSILGRLKKIAPSYNPWHGISSPEDRISNPFQIILQQSLHHETIGPLVGATMAQQTAAINE
jgi:hypothetical protein